MRPPHINNPQELAWDTKCSCKLIKRELISERESSVQPLDCDGLLSLRSLAQSGGSSWRLEGHALNFGNVAVESRAVPSAARVITWERKRARARRSRSGSGLEFESASSLHTLPPCLFLSGVSAVERSLLYLFLPAVRWLGNPPAGEQTHLVMDALKSAGRAIIKSPGVPRHTWGTSKHESEWDDTNVWKWLECCKDFFFF